MLVLSIYYSLGPLDIWSNSLILVIAGRLMEKILRRCLANYLRSLGKTVDFSADSNLKVLGSILKLDHIRPKELQLKKIILSTRKINRSTDRASTSNYTAVTEHARAF